MNRLTVLVFGLFMLMAGSAAAANPGHKAERVPSHQRPRGSEQAKTDDLSEQERRMGFISLFSGRNLRGWQPQEGPWAIEKDALVIPAVHCCPSSRNVRSDSLRYEAAHLPADLELRFLWMTKTTVRDLPAGDGSIQLRACTSESDSHAIDGEDYWSRRLKEGACRLQLCFRAGGRCLYLSTARASSNEAAKRLHYAVISSWTPSKVAVSPIGQWNEARIVCKGSL
ncbi:MAG: family 16 glycoside hydrolase, partial [Phycisphaerales bacterium]